MIVTHCSGKIFDGKKFYSEDDFDFSVPVITYNLKNYVRMAMKKLPLNKFHTAVTAIDYLYQKPSLEHTAKIDRILAAQSQNHLKRLDFIPEHIAYGYMRELHKIISKLSVNVNEGHNFVNSLVTYNICQLEDKNGIYYNLHGTKTGRITHLYINCSKIELAAMRQFSYPNQSLYEIDFKSFDITNMRTFLNLRFVEDPYDLENFIPRDILALDRDVVKNITLSYLYGMSRQAIINKYPTSGMFVEWLDKEFVELWEFKKVLLEQAEIYGYIKSPISGRRIYYEKGEEYDKKILNNFFQMLSSDIFNVKFSYFTMMTHATSGMNVLFPVYDSMIVSTEENVLRETNRYLTFPFKIPFSQYTKLLTHSVRTSKIA